MVRLVMIKENMVKIMIIVFELLYICKMMSINFNSYVCISKD